MAGLLALVVPSADASFAEGRIPGGGGAEVDGGGGIGGVFD